MLHTGCLEKNAALGFLKFFNMPLSLLKKMRLHVKYHKVCYVIIQILFARVATGLFIMNTTNLKIVRKLRHLILKIHEATTIKTIGCVRFFRKFYFWLFIFNTIASIRILNTSCMILNVHLILFYISSKL